MFFSEEARSTDQLKSQAQKRLTADTPREIVISRPVYVPAGITVRNRLKIRLLHFEVAKAFATAEIARNASYDRDHE